MTLKHRLFSNRPGSRTAKKFHKCQEFHFQEFWFTYCIRNNIAAFT